MAFASEGQTTYNLEPSAAAPGMLADLEDYSIESYVAKEVINPGVMVQLSSDGLTVQQARSLTATVDTEPTSVLGFAVLKTARAPSDATFGTSDPQVYQIGDIVPVLKRGKIWAAWHSAVAQPVGTNVGLNVYGANSNSGAHVAFRGNLTADAVSATSGDEICAIPGGIRLKPPALSTSGNICLAEVNLPGSSA